MGKLTPYQIMGHPFLMVSDGPTPGLKTLDLRDDPNWLRGPRVDGGVVQKALPRPKEEKVKSKPAGKASAKKAGAGGKTRYDYPQEKGKSKPATAAAGQPPQPQAPIPVPQEQAPPQANPADLANQLGMSMETLQRVAQRFVANPGLNGRSGFVAFMKTRLKDFTDKHKLEGDYYGLVYDSITGSATPPA